MAYRTVLFDLDHALLDSDESARLAFSAAMASVGREADVDLTDRFETINLGLWSRVEAGELSPNDIRWIRFDRLFAEAGIDADPTLAGNRYVDGLGEFGGFYPGTERVLDQVAAIATLGLVTNGIGEVQRARIARLELDRWFSAYVISGEVGVSKPDPAIFDLVFDELGGPDRSTTLMVGDSLTSDMAGGAAAGIDTAWFNPDGRSPDGVPITHRLNQLDQLVDLIDP